MLIGKWIEERRVCALLFWSGLQFLLTSIADILLRWLLVPAARQLITDALVGKIDDDRVWLDFLNACIPEIVILEKGVEIQGHLQTLVCAGNKRLDGVHV